MKHLLLFSLLTAYFFSSMPSQAGPLAEKKLGKQAISIVNGATKVEAVSEHGTVFKEGPIFKGRTQGKKFAAKIAALLLNDETFGSESTCIPDPGVNFTLWQGKHSVDVSLCFQCDMIFVYTNDAHGRIVKLAEGGFLRTRPQWVRLANATFPNDKIIQHLKEVDF